MFPLKRFRVEDHSMEPALRPGDYVIVNRWAYRKSEPQAGDVVVVCDPEAPGRFLVKRIMSGDRQAGFFVLGDNDAHSRDSRHFGPVPLHMIVGRMRFHTRWMGD